MALKERGLRMTPQRQLILDIVVAMHGHISVDQVHQHVVRQFPDVHITTVYRTLEVLEELGFGRHSHFHDILQPLAQELWRRYEFQSDLAHTAIVGVCPDCRRARTVGSVR